MKVIDVIYGSIVSALVVMTAVLAVSAKAPGRSAEETNGGVISYGSFAESVLGDADTTTEEKFDSEASIPLYDVPLDEDVQKFIMAECGSHGIDPALIMAMAWKESSFRSDVVGDNGASFGLLQIQKRWHEERMERLGVTDLLDTYQNVMVAVDYMAELIDYYGDVEMAVVAYNMGQAGAKKYCFDYGVYSSKYSRAVMVKAEELRREMTE
jgi:hypothetical protein